MSTPKSGGPARNGAPAASRSAARWGLLSLLAMVGFMVGIALLGATARSLVIGSACAVTRCSAAGMVTAGWLIVVLPVVVVSALALRWQRLGKIDRRLLVTAAAFSVGLAMLFMPTRRHSLSDLVTGPGAGQFADGITWAAGAVGVTLVLLLATAGLSNKLPVIDRRFPWIAAGLASILLVAVLPVAVSRTYPTYVTASDIFPTVLTMNGDTVTRTSAADRRGCDGVLADDGLLNGHHCILTLRAGFTTDDSDAVVTFQAILYLTEEAADEVRAGIPQRVSPVGAGDNQITTVSTAKEWVIMGTAAHADGRPIQREERSWVMWPVRQVSYHFIGTQVGLLVSPDPKDDISPRTP